METVVIQHSLSTDEGSKPTVVQGTAVASPYDHHTKQQGGTEIRDPTGPGVGSKQVSSEYLACTLSWWHKVHLIMVI
jgi:hypothetical protein